MKKWKLVLCAIAAVMTVGATAVVTTDVQAANSWTEEICESDEYDDEQKAAAGCTENRTFGGVANGIINTVLAVLGVVAVGAIILGGVQYATSAGDPAKIKTAKNTILYALMGLVIALLAFAIVNFVLTSID